MYVNKESPVKQQKLNKYHIYNLSVGSGICPDRLKCANIIPCFKKGDVTEIANYKPISLLTSFSKLFEILVFSRFKQHFIRNDILASEQYGFHEDVLHKPQFLI
jgi:hypothetical protein